jgi:hypothetical protein
VLSFESLSNSGLAIVDPIERRRYAFDTPASVTPEPADDDRFYFPVDRAVRVSTVELGGELRVPAELERPETGVRLKLPPTLDAAYVAAPLAYYLGVEMVSGDEPRLVTDDFEHPLPSTRFEREVERVLKRTFFLHCLTRTEGYYRVDLYEREQVDIDLDFAALYDLPIAEQLPAYLSVPFDRLVTHMPQWPLTAHVAPTPEHVGAIPFVVNDLGRRAHAQRDPRVGG